MALGLKKLVSKLELPTNDWVLSRFGGCEPPAPPATTEREIAEDAAEELAPVSQAPVSVAARLFDRLFNQSIENDAPEPPQSGERLSPNATGDGPSKRPPDPA
ncbi:MAG TPA: hypothetical protein VGC79_37225 [Polyangiaceae bacterium]